MGIFCSCCSRKTQQTNASKTDNKQPLTDDETEAMLNKSKQQQNIQSLTTKIGQQKQSSSSETINNGNIAGYGSTDNVQYTALKNDKHSAKTLQSKHKAFESDKFNKNIMNKSDDEQIPNTNIKNDGDIIDENDDDDDDDENGQNYNGIPTSQQNIIISDGGYTETNGNYRWFLHESKWCLLRKGSSYSLENGRCTDDVYSQLKNLQINESNFKWNDDIKFCWVITELDSKTIYYAAPQINDKYIPNNTKKWISVHGSLPIPHITPNLLHDTKQPSLEDGFGNLSSNKSKSNLNTISETQNIDDQEDDDYGDGHVGNRPKLDSDEQNHGVVVDEDDDDDDSDVSDLE